MASNKHLSWEQSAEWYHEYLQKPDTYQAKVLLPNIIRLLQTKKGEAVLDFACGQGFFARALHAEGASVIGVDISPTLIAMAKKLSPKTIRYITAPADAVSMIPSRSIDAIVIILAIQNIENISGVFKECARVLKNSGRMILVMNHPAFRIPKESSWGWDEKAKKQYRRIDRYLSELKLPIEMHPGKNTREITISFHRPLQTYAKILAKNNFAITRLEEWISHRKSRAGPRARAEDQARHEIPLFLALEIRLLFVQKK